MVHEDITAAIIPGDTIEDIEQTLSEYSHNTIQRLLALMNCEIGDLAYKIALNKNIFALRKTRATIADRE